MKADFEIAQLDATSDDTVESIAARARSLLADALVRTGRRDRAAFSSVYALTSAKLFGICLHVCGERTAAEDVLHEVYVTIWQRAATWDASRSSPITWLATIARNRAIDWRRAQGRQTTAPIGDAFQVIDRAPDPEASARASQEICHLRACLARLEPRQAEAIRAAFFQGLTYAELAERDGACLSTMKSRVRRGLNQLKVQMENSQRS